MELSFTKMHGLGNDFIVIEDLDEELDLAPEAVEWFCDRNFGIGADGLILVRPATLPDADFSWWFRNSDGSAAEMCGNGIRCFAKYVADHGLLPSRPRRGAHRDTRSASLPVEITRAYDGTLYMATVDMGEPLLLPDQIPTKMGCEAPEDPVVNCPLETELGTFRVTCVSMGNPHCVLCVDDVESAPVHTLGPAHRDASRLPEQDQRRVCRSRPATTTIRLRVWERGVGETLACGTGACAAAVAAALTCRIGRDATVELPGGELAIHWGEDGHVHMTGPAVEVFSGVVTIPEDDD